VRVFARDASVSSNSRGEVGKVAYFERPLFRAMSIRLVSTVHSSFNNGIMCHFEVRSRTLSELLYSTILNIVGREWGQSGHIPIAQFEWGKPTRIIDTGVKREFR